MKKGGMYMREFINSLFEQAYSDRGIIYLMLVFFPSLFAVAALDERFGIIRKIFSTKKEGGTK